MTTARDGSAAAAIDDVDDVARSMVDEGDEEIVLANPLVIAVPQLDSYKSCLVCKARVESSTPPLGECSKCSTMQQYDLCTNQLSARLMVKTESETLTLHAFGKIVEQLCNQPEGSRYKSPMVPVLIAGHK